eukprot:8447526-Alexandrium_andersonii.AAC.1
MADVGALEPLLPGLLTAGDAVGDAADCAPQIPAVGGIASRGKAPGGAAQGGPRRRRQRRRRHEAALQGRPPRARRCRGPGSSGGRPKRPGRPRLPTPQQRRGPSQGGTTGLRGYPTRAGGEELAPRRPKQTAARACSSGQDAVGGAIGLPAPVGIPVVEIRLGPQALREDTRLPPRLARGNVEYRLLALRPPLGEGPNPVVPSGPLADHEDQAVGVEDHAA